MGFTPRSIKIPLFSGDYQQRIDLIDADLEAARKAVVEARKTPHTLTLTDDDPVAVAEARVAAIEAEREQAVAEAEANGEVTIVTLQALSKKDGVPGRKRWNQLVRDHPPRTSEDVPEGIRESDKDLGVNDETFGEALVPLSVVEVSDPDLTVEDLLDNISSAQFSLLYAAAFGLNRAVGSNPKSLHRSQPSPSGSAIENSLSVLD